MEKCPPLVVSQVSNRGRNFILQVADLMIQRVINGLIILMLNMASSNYADLLSVKVWPPTLASQLGPVWRLERGRKKRRRRKENWERKDRNLDVWREGKQKRKLRKRKVKRTRSLDVRKGTETMARPGGGWREGGRCISMAVSIKHLHFFSPPLPRRLPGRTGGRNYVRRDRTSPPWRRPVQ